MTSGRDTTQIVRSWLQDGVDRLPDRVLDAVLDQLPATHQRRRDWWMPSWPDRTPRLTKFVVVSAVIVVAALLGLEVISLQNVGKPGPDATPATSAINLPLEVRSLGAGSYVLDEFPVEVEFDVPSGWYTCSESVAEQGVCTAPGNVGGEIGLSFLVVENVVADPCGERLLDPPVGPSVDDLVTAIANLDRFTVSAPRDVNVSGLTGKEITLTAPANPGCDLRTWSMGTRTNGVGSGERNVLRIVDVDGTRVMFAAASFPGSTPAESMEELGAVMDSIRIGTP